MTKEKFAWTGLGIPLTWLAQLDEVSAPNALADAFGDRYLYRYNAIFANIRNAAIDRGYVFSAEDSPLWRDYQALSLLALPRILQSRTIPYFNTSASFRRLLDAHPGLRLPPAFLMMNVKRNYAFHESAHCIAHSILQRMETDLRALAPADGHRFVLESILAESFANTVETLASVFRHMPVSDNIFFPLNSYFSWNQKREGILARGAAECGLPLRFALLFLAYFEANLASDPPADPTFDRIAGAANCPADAGGIARDIIGIGFGLYAGFRESTTPAYFELLGYTAEYKALACSAWLSQARNRDFARELIAELRQAAGGD